MIKFRCDCGKLLQAQEEYAGQSTTCPDCGRELRIPRAEPVPGDAPPMVLPVAREGPGGPPTRRRWEEDDRGHAAVPSGTSGKAITAFVLGLLSFVVPVLLSLVAIILAILGLTEISRGRGRVGGKGLAITGLVLGILSLVVVPVVVIIFAFQRVHEAAARAQSHNNLVQINLALLDYLDTNRNRLPPPVVYSPDGRPLYSWRVLVLPALGEGKLYQQFHLDEPWDSPHNKQFLKQMPQCYAHPLAPEAAAEGLTHYQVFVGKESGPGPRPVFFDNPRALQPLNLWLGEGRLFEAKGCITRYPSGIPDGPAQTILVAEAAEPVPWTKPADLSYSPQQPLPRLGGLFRGGFTVGMGDTSAHFVSDRVSEGSLRAAITADGNDVVGDDF